VNILSWVVYLLECKDNTYYCGITKDLTKRLEKHNNGTGAKYTRGRRPVVLIWSESHKNQSSALQREYEIKKMTRKNKESLISSTNLS
jgi:putative endonuclease